MRLRVDIPFRQMLEAQCAMRTAQRVVGRALSIGLCALGLSLPCAQRLAAQEGFSVEYLDRGADACTDFYQFACGNWLATHPLPADRPRYGRLNELADRNARIIRSILEQAAVTQSGR